MHRRKVDGRIISTEEEKKRAIESNIMVGAVKIQHSVQKRSAETLANRKQGEQEIRTALGKKGKDPREIDFFIRGLNKRLESGQLLETAMSEAKAEALKRMENA